MIPSLDTLLNWLSGLPLKYRQDLSTEITQLMPGLDINPYHRQFSDHFTAALTQMRQSGPCREEGLSVCLYALIDHIIATKNRQYANWEQEKKELDQFADMTGSCSVATDAANKAMQYRQWQDIAREWQTGPAACRLSSPA